MDKFYNISDVKFEKDYMFIKVDSVLYKIEICEASDKLAKANDQIRNDYKISPSGYGIHWKQLDEDLSINGLISIAKK
jgi:hypothetical protein